MAKNLNTVLDCVWQEALHPKGSWKSHKDNRDVSSLSLNLQMNKEVKCRVASSRSVDFAKSRVLYVETTEMKVYIFNTIALFLVDKTNISSC